MEASDQELFESIQQDRQDALKQLMERYWRPLFLMIDAALHDPSSSEDIVQEVFINIWNKRKTIQIKHSVKVYLFACGRYQLFREIQKRKIPHVAIESCEQHLVDPYDPSQALQQQEMLQALETLVNQLPGRCREVYRLKREENLSQKEIAELLQISRKSVENQLTIALKKIRTGLARYIFFL